jgi:hypothetical protein
MTDQIEKKQKVRSPNYPAITLERALDLTRTLHSNYNVTSVAFEVAAKALHYSSKSSAGMQTMAALSYYGLIDITGKAEDRRIKVTDLAFKIIMDDRPVSPERDAAIKQAALNPAIFKKIKEDYPKPLSDESGLAFDLKTKYKFNPGTVSDFISIYKKTMDFAKVYESDIMPEENNTDKESELIAAQEKTGSDLPGSIKSLAVKRNLKEREIANYPVDRGLNARIIFYGDSAITIRSIEKLIKLLDLNKEDFPETESEE